MVNNYPVRQILVRFPARPRPALNLTGQGYHFCYWNWCLEDLVDQLRFIDVTAVRGSGVIHRVTTMLAGFLSFVENSSAFGIIGDTGATAVWRDKADSLKLCDSPSAFSVGGM